MRIITIFLFSFVFVNITTAQKNWQEDSLCKICNRASVDSEKINAYKNLADHYFANAMYHKGDSILDQQVRLAILSNDNKLILKAYFDNTISDIPESAPQEQFDKAIEFLTKAIDYATTVNSYDNIVIGYIHLAKVLRKKGDTNKALQNSEQAMENLRYVKSDSIIAAVYIELGDIYHDKEEDISALKNYNSAYDVALRSQNTHLESTIYHRLAELHDDLNDSIGTIKLLFQSVNLNKATGNLEGLLQDYFDLARKTNQLDYINLVLLLADSLHSDYYKLHGELIMDAYLMVVEKSPAKTIEYLNSHTDLLANIKKDGMPLLNFYYGQTFDYGDNPDSAIYYYTLAKDGLVAKSNKGLVEHFYKQLAHCYELKKDYTSALKFYDSALVNAQSIRDLNVIYTITNSIADIYQNIADFRNAYFYKNVSMLTRDTLLQNANAHKLALLDVERETLQVEVKRKELEIKLAQSRNLQYTAIAIAIGLGFLFLFIIGMFPVSKFIIKLLNYFFFISLFEFLVLLIDTYLYQFTDGQPLRSWLIKIFLIAILVPFQHFLEHNLVRFFESRKLVALRNKLSIQTLFLKKKKIIKSDVAPILMKEHISFEDDTAVL